MPIYFGTDKKQLYIGTQKMKIASAQNQVISYETNQQDESTVGIYLNQTGFDIGKPKIVTISNTKNYTPFYVKKVSDNSIAYTGIVHSQKANFSDFNPIGTDFYYIECNGITSYNFYIGEFWNSRISSLPSLEFMCQSRQDTYDVGGSTGYAWRDGHQFSFEVNSLVWLYMSNPYYYKNISPTIPSVNTCQYTNLQIQTEPSIIWLMKFAMYRYYDLVINKGYTIHAFIKGQIAYFLYLYPYIKDYVSESFYTQMRDFVIAQWSVTGCTLEWYECSDSTDNNLFATQSIIGTEKGQKPPGFAIIPNLLMYEVAKRDGLSNYQDYFTSAYNNCEWIINLVDLTNPSNTKGQRMSERVTLEALGYFQKMYPSACPSGLLDKINGWIDSIISLSSNMWDLRKYSSSQWTGGLDTYNEPGSPLGFMACAYSAYNVASNITKKNRLEEIAFAQWDDGFGRNPSGRAFWYNANDLTGIDKGWYTYLSGGYGDLGSVVARIDGSPDEDFYPFNPNASVGYTEGWVAWNTAWNDSLAYLNNSSTEVKVFNNTFTNEITSTSSGATIGIQLIAPINLSDIAIETGKVTLTLSDGTSSEITVTETDINSFCFIGTYIVPSSITSIKVSYGIGIFEKYITLSIS